MYNDNYFKVGKTLTFAFDDYDAAEVYAHAAAVAANSGKRLSVWRMPKGRGPWTGMDIIGHRRDAEIVADIIAAELVLRTTGRGDTLAAVELDNLRDELATRRKLAPVAMS